MAELIKNNIDKVEEYRREEEEKDKNNNNKTENDNENDNDNENENGNYMEDNNKYYRNRNPIK